MSEFKRYLIERSRSPSDMPDAKGRALMACLNLPQPIQKWMVEASAAEPLFESIAKTIEAAEQHVREQCAAEIARLKATLDDCASRYEKLLLQLGAGADM